MSQNLNVPSTSANQAGSQCVVAFVGSDETVYAEGVVEEETVDVLPENDDDGQPENGFHQGEVRWTPPLTRRLIDLFSTTQNRRDINSMTKKKMWSIIANELGMSPEKCENRWKVLLRNYKDTVANNNKTGRGRRDFEFLSDMEPIMTKKRTVHPELVVTGDAEFTSRNTPNLMARSSPVTVVRRRDGAAHPSPPPLRPSTPGPSTVPQQSEQVTNPNAAVRNRGGPALPPPPPARGPAPPAPGPAPPPPPPAPGPGSTRPPTMEELAAWNAQVEAEFGADPRDEETAQPPTPGSSSRNRRGGRPSVLESIRDDKRQYYEKALAIMNAKLEIERQKIAQMTRRNDIAQRRIEERARAQEIRRQREDAQELDSSQLSVAQPPA